MLLEVAFEGHCSYIIFNVIKTPSNLVIFYSYGLEEYSPSVDWGLQKMTFSLEHFEDKRVMKSNRKLQMKKSLFIGVRVFVTSFKEGTPFCHQPKTTTMRF